MRNWRVIALGIAGGCALATVAAPTHAEIFRCTTLEGKTLYSDSPCPREARAVNISARVGVCESDACRADREERAADALARLRAEEQALASLTEQRRKTEAQELAERIKLEELRRLTALNQALAADAQVSQQEGVYYPLYPWYPAIGRPCGVRCLHPRPPSAHHPHPPIERRRPFNRVQATTVPFR